MTAYAQYRLAVATIERNRDLYAQKLITPKQFEKVNADYEVAQATYQSLMDQMGFEARLANTRAQQAEKTGRDLGPGRPGAAPDPRRQARRHRARGRAGKVLGVKPDGTLPARPRSRSPRREARDILPPEKRRARGRRAGRLPADPARACPTPRSAPTRSGPRSTAPSSTAR